MMSGATKRLVFKPLAELEAFEIERWDELLASESSCRKAFLSHAYAAAASRCGFQVHVAVASIDGVPCWFLPLQRHTGWIGNFGVFEPVGGVMSDYFGAVAAPGLRVSPEEILAATKGKASALLFTHLDETQQAFGLRGEEPRIGLRTCIGPSGEDYWERLRVQDKKLVYDTERREKKLIREHGPICFDWQSTNLRTDLAALIEMKQAQYSRTGRQEAPLFAPSNVELLELLSLSEDNACSGILSTVRCGNRLVAAHFGLRCHETLHVWFPVYDPEFANYSPGRILLKHIIHAAGNHGIQVLDRGEGDTQAKRDFANEEHRYFRGFWRSATLGGACARVATAVHWRLAN